jgi:hypothetical protein
MNTSRADMIDITVIQGKIECGELEGINVWDVHSEDPYAKYETLWKLLSKLHFDGHQRLKMTIEVLDG